jgi:two-component system, chemotaxis family, chemotaxis protein CheY
MGFPILVVDDSRAIRQMLSLTLICAGYEVHTAADGREAMDSLDTRRYALVISDVTMPRLDGLGLVREMKAHPAHRAIPVLMLTKEYDDDLRAAAHDAGATAWLNKPFSVMRVLDVVARLMRQ